MSDGPADDDFGALLEASLGKKRRRLSVGDRVRGTIVQVGHESLIVDLGDSQDGLLDLRELGEGDARPELKEGDVIEAYVLRFEDRVAELGMKAGRGGGARGAQLEDALRSGLPVEGVVTEVNKGGYVVETGGARAFCPLGAMDLRRIEDPATMIGRKLLFRVTEMKGPRDVVLSRRAILEEENAQRAAETRERIAVGARMRGTVISVRDFGAFVDLGGIDGLVPVSEMAYGRSKAEEAVKVGQQVDVEIIRIEEKEGKERITLSMKALLDDPFGAVAAELTPGLIVAGTVTRVQPFGAFVQLVPGVEGLVHVSAFGKRIGSPAEMVRVGQEVAVRVEGVDADARRISLHHADQAELAAGPAEPDPARAGLRVLRHAEPAEHRVPAAAPADRAARESAPAIPTARIGDIVETTVDRVETYGLFVSWPGGRGLLPSRELGVPRTADLRRQYSAGAKLKAAVIDIRPDGKITLSKTAVERAEERAETDAYMKTSPPPSSRGLGSLGDLSKLKKGR